MNELTPYEQLIAAKLEQLPVPDMADSIWATIETQLDPPPKSNMLHYLATIITLVVLFTLPTTPPSTPPPQPLPPTTIQPTPVPQPAPQPHVPSPNKKITAPTRVKVDTPVMHTPKIDSIRVDTPHTVPHFAPGITPRITPTVPDFDPYELPPTPPPPAKKRRGVKGITDNDYKLSTKKDSTNKKN